MSPDPAEIRLPAEAASAWRARRFVAAVVRPAGFPAGPCLDRLLLVTSELVTNAILHAGTYVRVMVRVDPASVCVAVEDGSRRHPRRAGASLTDTYGRGLPLVDTLVDEWGVTDIDDGKTVWARIGAN